MSCNGCRVLRKGCSDSCILRPCLQWIEPPEAQGHATVFLAKFFGRSGLLGFISAAPERQRPALFKSLLFEACGRTVNPIFGAVGLMWSGNWDVCQEAVETVLQGGVLRPLSSPVPSANPVSLHSLTDRPQTPPQRSSHASVPSNIAVKRPHRRPQSKRLHCAQQEMTHLNLYQSQLDGLNQDISLHNARIHQAQIDALAHEKVNGLALNHKEIKEPFQAQIDGFVQEQMNPLAPHLQGIYETSQELIKGFIEKISALSSHPQEIKEPTVEQINALLTQLQEVNKQRLHVANPDEELKKGLILQAGTIQEEQLTGQLVAPVPRRIRLPLNAEAMAKSENHGNNLELGLSLNPHANMVDLSGMKLGSNYLRVSSLPSNASASEDSAATSGNRIMMSLQPQRSSLLNEERQLLHLLP